MAISLTGEQLRAARAMVRMDRKTFAAILHLTPAALKRMERTTGPLQLPEEMFETLRISLGDVGIELIDSGSYFGVGGPGVRLIGEPVAALDLLDEEHGQTKEPPEEMAVPA